MLHQASNEQILFPVHDNSSIDANALTKQQALIGPHVILISKMKPVGLGEAKELVLGHEAPRVGLEFRLKITWP